MLNFYSIVHYARGVPNVRRSEERERQRQRQQQSNVPAHTAGTPPPQHP
jgi:hypothetical protein